jgi:hypothetical protein
MHMVMTSCISRFQPNSMMAWRTELTRDGRPKKAELVSLRKLAVNPGSYLRISSILAALESGFRSKGTSRAAVAGMPGNDLTWVRICLSLFSSTKVSSYWGDERTPGMNVSFHTRYRLFSLIT